MTLPGSDDASATDAPVTAHEFDRLFADSMGPYLRVYLSVRLADRAAVPAALEEVYASLLATGALIHAGDRQSFQTRAYALVDKVLPHLGQPALRKPRPPELEERARRFVELVAGRWHEGFEEAVRATRALADKEREAVLLRDYREWTMQEIAQKLGMSIEAARAFVNAAREKVRHPRPVPGLDG